MILLFNASFRPRQMYFLVINHTYIFLVPNSFENNVIKYKLIEKPLHFS